MSLNFSSFPGCWSWFGARKSAALGLSLRPLCWYISCLSAQGADLYDHVETFWRLESMGITDSAASSDDANAQAQFKQSISFADGRAQVSWPWKDANLPNNFNLAKGRLKSLLCRL